MTLTFTHSITTAGESLFGVALAGGGNSVAFDVKFTTTQTAPTGTFQPNTVFQIVYDRQLVN